MNNNDICRAIQDKIGELFICSQQGDRYQVRTPYLYPDGDNIDLYCEVAGDIVTVTDLAETTGMAADAVTGHQTFPQPKPAHLRHMHHARSRVSPRDATSPVLS